MAACKVSSTNISIGANLYIVDSIYGCFSLEDAIGFFPADFVWNLSGSNENLRHCMLFALLCLYQHGLNELVY